MMQVTLRAARINAGYTQRQAAVGLGVTRDTIGNWERGRSFPDAVQIKKIEEFYGIPYDNLLFLPSNTLKA